jgi:methylthioribose-1-phosphate isomerase
MKIPTLRTVEWVGDARGRPVPGRVRFVDQTRLPLELVAVETADPREIWTAIKTLQVRGAPAIGIAAAMGVAAAAQAVRGKDGAAVARVAGRAADYLATSRPTAVNLFWALDRMKAAAARHAGMAAGELRLRLVREAMAIRDEDAAMCRRIGRHGASLLRDGAAVLTHCNAGGLAASEFGTALAPVYVAAGQGKRVRVYADETRPLLQGARLTAWELMRAGIEVTLICDNTAAQVMKEGRVNAVLVGADRIAANGDSANKIGTYGLAVLAKAHRIPFYVLAPSSTVDFRTARGRDIVIEERGAEEVTSGFGRRTAPEGVRVYAPAFDVTPARLISAIVCERGVARAPYGRSLARLLGRPRTPRRA